MMRMRTTRTNEHDSNVLLSSCTAEDQKKRTGRKRFCWLLIPASAFLLAALLNLFVIICAVVPSASMADTISEGALMVASRLAYVGGEPGRGDVVLFRHEELGGSLIVKRVVGLPGERVEIRQGQVFINGEPLAEDYVKGERTGDFEGVDVPEDCYFLLGDNRQHSYDAREWSNPFVERKKIAAKAEFVLFPAFKRIK